MLGGSYDASKIAVSVEAMSSFYHVKAQLLFILIETLDLENLLRMVHDGVPFRYQYFNLLCCSFIFFSEFLFYIIYLVISMIFSEASCAFSLTDIQEIDAEVSNFSEELERESGPLVLAWAVHLCLVSSMLESGADTLMVLLCLPVFLFLITMSPASGCCLVMPCCVFVRSRS